MSCVDQSDCLFCNSVNSCWAIFQARLWLSVDTNKLLKEKNKQKNSPPNNLEQKKKWSRSRLADESADKLILQTWSGMRFGVVWISSLYVVTVSSEATDTSFKQNYEFFPPCLHRIKAPSLFFFFVWKAFLTTQVESIQTYVPKGVLRWITFFFFF